MKNLLRDHRQGAIFSGLIAVVVISIATLTLANHVDRINQRKAEIAQEQARQVIGSKWLVMSFAQNYPGANPIGPFDYTLSVWNVRTHQTLNVPVQSDQPGFYDLATLSRGKIVHFKWVGRRVDAGHGQLMSVYLKPIVES